MTLIRSPRLKFAVSVAALFSLCIYYKQGYATEKPLTTISAGKPMTEDTLKGEWRFARPGPSKWSSYYSPPTWDVILFIPPKKVILQSTLRNMTFEGTATLVDGTLKITFRPPDRNEPVKDSFACAHAIGDHGLVVSAAGHDFVYYRPDRFLPNDQIAGHWKDVNDDDGNPTIFQTNGTIQTSSSTSPTMIYRLWPAEGRSFVSMMFYHPSRGAFFALYRYEKNKGFLNLTPVSGEGIVENEERKLRPLASSESIRWRN